MPAGFEPAATRWLVRRLGCRRPTTGVELGKGSVAIMLAGHFGAVIGIFFLVPLFVASATTGGQGDFVQHLIEGLVRVALFIGYLLLIRASGESGASSSTTAPST